MKVANIYYEEDLLDINFLKKVIEKLDDDENHIRNFLNKLSFAFIRESENFRKEIIIQFLNKFESKGEDFFFRIGRDTLCGSVIILYIVLEKHPVISIQNVHWYKKLSDLEFILNGAIDLVPKIGEFDIVFDERLTKSCSALDKSNLIELTELFFITNIIKKNLDNFKSLLELYRVGGARNSDKKEILDSLINNNFDKFLSCVRKYDSNIRKSEDFLNNYSKIYNLLLESGVFVYFDFDNLIFNGVATNKNLYPVKYLDRNKKEAILMPFQNLSNGDLEKAYDIHSESYAIPLKSCKKFTLRDIYSFKDAEKIKITAEEIKQTKKLSEDEIIETISVLIGDPNKTTHSPAEKADLYTGKLKINNETDLRDVAFIIKGKSFPKITPKDVSHQIIKASNTEATILFLGITGNLFDESRDNFISIAKLANKGYCILDVVDLTKIRKLI
ncbi:MAG: hypothetical protein KKG94_00345 [Nanoarchaeota archaeon]|nr:hypothetical protein [Nanoarchaeota archaeon]